MSIYVLSYIFAPIVYVYLNVFFLTKTFIWMFDFASKADDQAIYIIKPKQILLQIYPAIANLDDLILFVYPLYFS